MTTLLVPERLLNVATKIVQRLTPTMPFPLALVAATTMSAAAAVVVVRSADHSRTGMPLDLRRHRSNSQSAPSRHYQACTIAMMSEHTVIKSYSTPTAPAPLLTTLSPQ